MVFEQPFRFFWGKPGQVFHDDRPPRRILLGVIALHTQIRQNVRHHRSHSGCCHHAARNVDPGCSGRCVQCHQYNILRIFHGRNPHKGNNFIQNPLSIFIKNIDFFTGSGLSADGKTRHLCIFRRSLFHHGPNEGAHGVGGFLTDCPADNRRLLLQNGVAFGIDHFTDQIRLHEVAAVDNGGDGPNQLQGRQFEGLTKGGGG